MNDTRGYTLVPVVGRYQSNKKELRVERKKVEQLLLSEGYDLFFYSRFHANRARELLSSKHGAITKVKDAIILKEKGA